MKKLIKLKNGKTLFYEPNANIGDQFVFEGEGWIVVSFEAQMTNPPKLTGGVYAVRANAIAWDGPWEPKEFDVPK